MDVSVYARWYNGYGGSRLYEPVADLLTLRLGDYGAAVQSVELIACLPNRSPKPLPALEGMFEQSRDHVKGPPRVTFRRKLRRIEISFLSPSFFAEDEQEQQPPVAKYADAPPGRWPPPCRC